MGHFCATIATQTSSPELSYSMMSAASLRLCLPLSLRALCGQGLHPSQPSKEQTMLAHTFL